MKKMYNLPEYNIKAAWEKILKTLKNKKFLGIFFVIIIGCALFFYGVISAWRYFPAQTKAFLQYFKAPEIKIEKNADKTVSSIYISKIPYEQAIIDTAKNVSPSVVSIIVSKKIPVYQKIASGSGFIVSADGLILTNKHVVSDKKADYEVATNDGQKYSAKVLVLDPVQDLAIIKIQLKLPDEAGKTFQPVVLGDSSAIQIGQTAIAIGNSLGEFYNTVSVGVVSGLQRTISASSQDGSFSERLEGIIQTDAAINTGNSGGPLLNLNGEVIGVNTAIAEAASSVSFAIPINIVKKDIEQFVKTNKIVYPFVGVRYLLINKDVKVEYKLSVDDGALVSNGDNGEPAITAGSPASKAGIKVKDIILQINGEKITLNNSLSTIIQKYKVGDTILLHILRSGKEIDVNLVLGERSS
jgi:serine protease Do